MTPEEPNPILGEMKLRNRTVTKKDLKLEAELEAEREASCCNWFKRNLWIFVLILLVIGAVYITLQSQKSSGSNEIGASNTKAASNG